MNYKLISIDNHNSKGTRQVGNEHNFTFDGHQFVFGDIRSSSVSSIVLIENEMTVKTKNSTYKFERVIMWKGL